MLGNFCPLKSPIIAQRHLCLPMFEGKHLINILKIQVKMFVIECFQNI